MIDGKRIATVDSEYDDTSYGRGRWWLKMLLGIYGDKYLDKRNGVLVPVVWLPHECLFNKLVYWFMNWNSV